MSKLEISIKVAYPNEDSIGSVEKEISMSFPTPTPTDFCGTPHSEAEKLPTPYDYPELVDIGAELGSAPEPFRNGNSDLAEEEPPVPETDM